MRSIQGSLLHLMLAAKKLLPGLVIAFFVLFSNSAYSDTSVLPIAKNLQELGKQATEQNLPIAILFSAKGLKSTENLKDEAILPTLYSGQLDGYVLMTEINVNVDETTVDFYGETLANEEFKALYNLSSLPVVIFVDGEGEVITNQLLSGAYDFYPFYLKQSINQSLKALNNPKQIPQ
ncbi:hypothetical protein THMIRHAM_06960 [Thiomicrorhabdus immobilis]|uniref:Uncharacterized protein n=1 Tax=Thiomicrorhabdus immobilis TaxID=2791037 RepID=A0ABM7MC41_9GAMM|nr:hypothetical protein [Thiomicrorhabdus immobilis]BCN92911.1 hypothetical protein THMIRHAM_06960 [Thiomicrorhabdus immobilis]